MNNVDSKVEKSMQKEKKKDYNCLVIIYGVALQFVAIIQFPLQCEWGWSAIYQEAQLDRSMFQRMESVVIKLVGMKQETGICWVLRQLKSPCLTTALLRATSQNYMNKWQKHIKCTCLFYTGKGSWLIRSTSCAAYNSFIYSYKYIKGKKNVNVLKYKVPVHVYFIKSYIDIGRPEVCTSSAVEIKLVEWIKKKTEAKEIDSMCACGF